MLLKGGIEPPFQVTVFAADPLDGGSAQSGPAAAPDVTNSALDALAAARAENEVLRTRLLQVEGELRTEIALAREAGRREAAEEHIRDDDAQLAVLSAALVAARESFVAELRGTTQTLAAQLAGAALQCLVDVCRDDEDWLLRVVTRRLAELDTSSVVAVVLPDGCRGFAERLEAPAGTAVVFDSRLPVGSARINLAMGEIPIRIEEGLARVLAALNPENDPHG